MKPSTSLLAALTAVLAACGGDKDLAIGKLPPAGRGATGSTVLRIPSEGGVPRLYRIPALDSSNWKSEDKLPPLERTIGADPELGQVFFLDKKRNVVALDLETRRVRPNLEQVREAAIGPDGALYAIDTGSTVTQLVRRAPIRFRSKLKGKATELHGTMSGMLVARLAGNSPALEMLGSDQPPESVPTPAGPIAPSLWGDLVAVAADSAVILYGTQAKKGEPRVLRVAGHARAALFSPSGHRIYVARDKESLLVLDRFSGEELEEIALPGPSAGLRADPFGQWILVQPAAGDSAWVVDVGTSRVAGSLPVRWDDDLPALVPPGILLVRRGNDVVSIDLAAEGFPERGKVAGGAADAWLPVAWQPQQDEGAEEPVDSALAEAADSAGSGRNVYLQVSSSQNPAWADELSQKLRTAGLPASVLKPSRTDEAYRVVLGPYATREQAEETGRTIGMPSFVVTPSDAPSR